MPAASGAGAPARKPRERDMSGWLIQDVLGVASGVVVGFSLGLVGGGGSILAVPLMIYLVGVPSAHVAIGTSALAVAVNAAANLVQHARNGTVKWRCASVFAATGVIGAFGGSSLEQDGGRAEAARPVRDLNAGGRRPHARPPLGRRRRRRKLDRENLPKLLALGLATGSLSGFFGIGGGFLIVPGLMLSTGMPILNAVGSSLIAVAAFGATAAANYALSGLVDWWLAAIFICGGLIGGIAGARLAGTSWQDPRQIEHGLCRRHLRGRNLHAGAQRRLAVADWTRHEHQSIFWKSGTRISVPKMRPGQAARTRACRVPPQFRLWHKRRRLRRPAHRRRRQLRPLCRRPRP